MRVAPKIFLNLSAALVLCTALPASAATHKHSSSKHSTHKAAATPSMSSERATAIQSALIKQGYLAGAPSGVWDTQSIAAMQKLQSDNGWQTKYTPDARALNKLGLGSSSDGTTQIAQGGE
ncbi:MAG: peptidoglycan-binding protein [Acidobacteriaceae bacterium]|nr:peptidoglycan-binding protein [Acidobacteriaceae bacterium]